MRIKSKLPRLALVYDWRGRSKNGGPQPVELRVSMNGQRKYFPTGVKIMSCHWKDGQVFNRGDMATLNERLNVCLRRANAYVTSCIDAGRPVEWSGFENVYKGIIAEEEDKSTDFFEFCLMRAEARGVAPGTRKRYDVFIRNLEDYGKIMSFADLTPENIMEYHEWHVKRGLSLISIYSNYHKCMKIFIGDAIRMRKMSSNPYDLLTGYIKKVTKPNPDYLTAAEVKKIEEAELPTVHLQKVRDLFLFQCYTGLAYAELSSFDFRNYTLQDGYYVSTGERKKTGTKFTSILLPKAIEIVRKYGGRELPVMCNNDYNRDLKLLAAHAGIKKRIYSHLGRHTFATMALAHGVSVQNVSRMIGHSSLRQTLHYAKILEQSVISDVAAHLGDDSSK